MLLGWPDLEHESLAPEVLREVRLHHDVALTVPDYSLRLVDKGHQVSGEVLIHWPGIDFEQVTGGDPGCQAWHEAERRQLAQQVARSHWEHYRCGPVQVAPRVEGCRVSFAAEPGWAEMLRRADSLGIWGLDSLVPRRLGLDGFDVSVELRDHTGYRLYEYHNPETTGGNTEKQVAALAELLDAVLEAAHIQARQQ